MSCNATTRFSDRVDFYIKFRPGYPAEILPLLNRKIGLSPSSVIADVGSGTGILAALFLQAGNRVFGIEPNAEMRAAGERFLRGYDQFISINGTAEDTTLAASSVDFITAGQAFHWFEAEQARREFQRILKPDGFVVLLWNDRHTDTTAFLQGYEQLLREFSLDYQQVDHKNINAEKLGQFFGAGGYKEQSLFNCQMFDYEGLAGRLLSSSYAPLQGHPKHEPMLQRLREIFDAHQVNGQVSFAYDTRIYYGQLG